MFGIMKRIRGLVVAARCYAFRLHLCSRGVARVCIFCRFSEFEASSDPFPVGHAHRQDRVAFAFRSVRNTRFLRARHVSFGVRSTVEFALNRAPAQAYVWVGRPATCFDAFRGGVSFCFRFVGTIAGAQARVFFGAARLIFGRAPLDWLRILGTD